MKNLLFILIAISFAYFVSTVFSYGLLDPYLGDELGQKHDYMTAEDVLQAESQSKVEAEEVKIVLHKKRCVLVARNQTTIDVYVLTPSSGSAQLITMSSGSRENKIPISLKSLKMWVQQADSLGCKVELRVLQNVLEITSPEKEL